MALYWNPDGTGPFFRDGAAIPGGSEVVVTTPDGTAGSGVNGIVITALRFNLTVLEYKTRPFTNGFVGGPESGWTVVP